MKDRAVVKEETRAAVQQHGITSATAAIGENTFTAAMRGDFVPAFVEIDLQCAIDRARGQMSTPPTFEAMSDIAAAVLRQAREDLQSDDPEERSEARHFFEVELWLPDCPWARILGFERFSFLRDLKRYVRAEYLADYEPAGDAPLTSEELAFGAGVQVSDEAAQDAAVIPHPDHQEFA